MYHTLSHYLNFERLLIARIGPSIKRHLESMSLLASGQATSSELLSALGMQIDEANAIELARAKGNLENARKFEIDLASRDSGSSDKARGSRRRRTPQSENTAVDEDTAKGTMRVAELHGEHQLKTYSYVEFQVRSSNPNPDPDPDLDLDPTPTPTPTPTSLPLPLIQALLATLRSENVTIAKAASKVSAAI